MYNRTLGPILRVLTPLAAHFSKRFLIFCYFLILFFMLCYGVFIVCFISSFWLVNKNPIIRPAARFFFFTSIAWRRTERGREGAGGKASPGPGPSTPGLRPRRTAWLMYRPVRSMPLVLRATDASCVAALRPGAGPDQRARWGWICPQTAGPKCVRRGNNAEFGCFTCFTSFAFGCFQTCAVRKELHGIRNSAVSHERDRFGPKLHAVREIERGTEGTQDGQEPGSSSQKV